MTGKIYKVHEKNRTLIEVTEEGLCFFKEDSTACSSKTDNVGSILRIRKTTEGEIMIENIKERDELEYDGYVNEVDINTIGTWYG